MAYFPNGSAAIRYLDRFCEHCVNWRDNGKDTEGCFIQDLHSLWNYDAANGQFAPVHSEQRAKYDALEFFIPTSPSGGGAEQCRMFVPKNPDEELVDKTQALTEWEAIYGKRAE